jgi:hypothetical protein
MCARRFLWRERAPLPCPRVAGNPSRLLAFPRLVSTEDNWSSAAAEELLERMLGTADRLCAERGRQPKRQRIKYPGTGKAIKGPIERRFR